ncbi:hypothetical protein ACFVTX_18185 [Agromyces sp. NPDC058136]|uniref:hypothetical protein n=1 Tax=Agromyces sp. NPDC058136 TaxID=3346354 RepID=UPI0036DDFD72
MAGLITLDEAKNQIMSGRTGGYNVIDDVDLQGYIDAATPVIEEIVGPLMNATKTYERDGGKTGVQLPTAVATVTEVREDDVAIDDYFASPTTGIVYAGTRQQRRRFAPGIRNIAVTVTVGRTVPANVKLATRVLVAFWWQQDRQGNERPGVGVEASDEPMTNTPSGFAIPRRVLQLCRPDAVTSSFG